MNIAPMTVLAVLLGAAAGFGVFLVLLNRLMILLPDSRGKAPLIAGVLAALTAGGVLFGWLGRDRAWHVAPAAVLGLLLLGELHRLRVRRRCAGTPPVDTTLHDVPLLSPITTTDFAVHRYEVPLATWPGSPLRIAHLTDLHVHAGLPLDYYRAVLAAAEAARPDLAVFTGDFITHRDAVPLLRQVLRPIATCATVAVLGNHDYWAGAEAVAAAVRDCGIHLLADNSLEVIAASGRVALSGCDHPWGRRLATLAAAPAGALRVVLSHTPDNIYRLARAGADLVFAGHCHAGQARIPRLGAIVVPSVYGRRFDHGHFVVNGTHLFVASGVGAANPPVRLYCQPDVFIVEVTGA